MKRIIHTLLVVLLSATTTVANADIDLVIDKSGDESLTSLILAPFQGGASAEKLRSIVHEDLIRSGRFNFIEANKAGYISPFGGTLDPAELKKSGAEFLLRGKTILQGSDTALEVELIDTHNGRKITGFLTPPQENMRAVAHKTADAVFKQLIGIPGVFDTKIAYVAANGAGDDRIYQLIIADADGYNPQSIVSSLEPIMSVAWAPNGKELAYVSFESGNPAIYIQDLRSGERRLISAREGLNGAPAWSHDGRKLAVSLSLEGNAEIYTLDIATGKLTRLTNSRAIDTEPAWTTDDNAIIFTSDRGGNPQLYKISTSGEQTGATRLTFEGRYNSAPSISGNKVALISQSDGKFRVALMDLGNKQTAILSKGGLDESPSIAANGTMVLFETRGAQRRSTLAVVSDNGRLTSTLYSPYADVGHPSWSPYLH